MNFLSVLLLSSAKAGAARLANARPAATSGTARRVHMAAERGAGAIIFRPEAQAAKRRSASSLESMIARAMGCAKASSDLSEVWGGYQDTRKASTVTSSSPIVVAQVRDFIPSRGEMASSGSAAPRLSFACVLERHYSMALESTLQAAGLDDEEIAFVNCVEPTDEDVVSLP